MKQAFLTITALTLIIVTMAWVVAPTAVFAAESLIDDTTFANEGQNHQSSQNAACINDSTCFVFYMDSGGGLSMASTTDGGATWVAGRNVDSINTTDIVAHAIWYEGWTATTAPAQYIHIVTADTSEDDTYYTRYDIANNTFSSTATTSTEVGRIFARGADQSIDITQTSSGRLYIGSIMLEDTWFDTCTSNCTDSANWSEATTEPFINGEDVVLMAPVGTTDNLMAVQRDFSLDTLVWATYSATSSSWSGTTTIDTALAENSTDDTQLSSIAFASSTGHVFVTLVDDVTSYVNNTSDLESYVYTEAAGWTITTPVIVNAAGAITGTKAAIDTSSSTAPNLYAFYIRRTTAGTATSSNMYYRYSTTTGNTWSDEFGPLNDSTDDLDVIMSNGASADIIGAFYRYVNAPQQDDLYYNLAVNLTPWTPPGGGGGGGGGAPVQSEFFFGILLPYWKLRKRYA